MEAADQAVFPWTVFFGVLLLVLLLAVLILAVCSAMKKNKKKVRAPPKAAARCPGSPVFTSGKAVRLHGQRHASGVPRGSGRGRRDGSRRHTDAHEGGATATQGKPLEAARAGTE